MASVLSWAEKRARIRARAKREREAIKGMGWRGRLIANRQDNGARVIKVIVPIAVEIDRDFRLSLKPRSLTALICGDPPFGCSAAERAPVIYRRQYDTDNGPVYRAA